MKKSNLIIAILIIGLVLSFGIAKAYVPNEKLEFANNLLKYLAGSESEEDMSFGASSDYCSGDEATTNLCVVDIYDLTIDTNGDFTVNSTAAFNASTTVQEISLGSRFYEALDFTAGNTTTPGAIASIQNTGADKLCNLVQLDIATGSTTGGLEGGGSSYHFGVSTGTSATTWTASGGLIASTTVATSSTITLDSVNEVGSYGRTTFNWDNGVYINAGFDVTDAQATASSTAYTSMSGGLYVHCITK